jgi:hypothetical protein
MRIYRRLQLAKDHKIDECPLYISNLLILYMPYDVLKTYPFTYTLTLLQKARGGIPESASLFSLRLTTFHVSTTDVIQWQIREVWKLEPKKLETREIIGRLLHQLCLVHEMSM